jgi:vanillate O-demethylase ferredoxin subunit
MQVRIAAIEEVTPQVKCFELVSADTAVPLPAYSCGAHVGIPVLLPDGSCDSRSYSIVNPPACQGFYRLAVQREKNGRGGSAYMHEKLSVGDEFEIEPPKNHFELVSDAAECILIAGGIGITPILCMASQLVMQDRPFTLHYAARQPELMAFRDEVLGTCQERARLWFDGGDPARGMDLKAILGGWREGLHVYVCGPAGLIDAVLATTRSCGWPEAAVHFELFSNPLAAVQDGDCAVEVVLQHSGVVLTVPPGTSILDAILDAGIDADFDCKVGECGSCLTTVLEGTPMHRDYYLNARERAENRSICTCVSRATGPRLVLDL